MDGLHDCPKTNTPLRERELGQGGWIQSGPKVSIVTTKLGADASWAIGYHISMDIAVSNPPTAALISVDLWNGVAHSNNVRLLAFNILHRFLQTVLYSFPDHLEYLSRSLVRIDGDHDRAILTYESIQILLLDAQLVLRVIPLLASLLVVVPSACSRALEESIHI